MKTLFIVNIDCTVLYSLLKCVHDRIIFEVQKLTFYFTLQKSTLSSNFFFGQLNLHIRTDNKSAFGLLHYGQH